MSKRILYVRSGPYEVNPQAYNLQEIGLAKEFCRNGFDVDVAYYTKSVTRVEDLDVPMGRLRILWLHGIKILRSGIYHQLYNRKFLAKYDIIFVSEYSQINSLIVGRLHPNVYLYNGPYYDLFKIPFTEKIYDALFVKPLNHNIKHFFCKTRMSQRYLESKGFSNCSTVGVGLDTQKFSTVSRPSENLSKLLAKMHGKRNLLYIGSISARKNTKLLIQSFIELRRDSKYSDVQLVLVGADVHGYRAECMRLIPDALTDSVVWKESVANSETQFLYKAAKVFLLPSTLEIFGMVLLEALYFGVPTIASLTAGADTLIDNKINGVIVDSFKIRTWVDNIALLLDDTKYATKLGKAAGLNIQENFTWKSIVEKMMGELDHESKDTSASSYTL